MNAVYADAVTASSKNKPKRIVSSFCSWLRRDRVDPLMKSQMKNSIQNMCAICFYSVTMATTTNIQQRRQQHDDVEHTEAHTHTRAHFQCTQIFSFPIFNDRPPE